MSTLESYIGAMVDANEPVAHRVCSIPECGRQHSAKGFCTKHYCRFLKHGDANVSLRHKAGVPLADDNPCKVIKSTDYPRLVALLRKDCIRHTEIAKRFGVSRERIRQLADKLGMVKGRIRRKSCTLNRSAEQAQAEFEREFFWLIAACPVPVSYIERHQGMVAFTFRKRQVLINGKRWWVSHGNIREGHYHANIPNRPCVVRFPDGVMVIPGSAPKTKALCFSLNPDPRYQTKEDCFYGWPSYWNAWGHVK